jgi:hypothetical protein
VGVCAFPGSLRGLESAPSKWRCLVPPTSGKRQPLGNHFMNFKSYNLFMAIVVSLRELVDELKIITDEHHVFLNKVTGKTVTLTDEDISAVESGDDTAERQNWEQEVFEQAKEVLWSEEFLDVP